MSVLNSSFSSILFSDDLFKKRAECPSRPSN